MRAFDKVLRIIDFACLVFGLLLVVRFAMASLVRSASGPEGDLVGSFLLFGLLWLPPALALWCWNGALEARQSFMFYLLSAMSLGAAVFVVALLMAIVNFN